MFDFTRAIISGAANIKKILSTVKDWEHKVDEVTGEVIKSFAKIGSIKITVTRGNTAFISGSIHTFYHGANYNNFYFKELCWAIDLLSEQLGISAKDIRVTKIEFGLNVKIPHDVKKILSSYYQHGVIPFYAYSNDSNNVKIGVIAKHKQFHTKAYGKTLHYIKCIKKFPAGPIESNLLRLEIKVVKMQYFKAKIKNKLVSLEDLKNLDLLKELRGLLLECYDSILKVEDVAFREMTDKEQSTFHAYRDYIKARDFMEPKDRDHKSTYRGKNRRFKALHDKYKTTSRHDEIRPLIVAQWDKLQNNNYPKVRPYLPPFAKTDFTKYVPIYPPPKRPIRFDYSLSPIENEDAKYVPIYPLYKCENKDVHRRDCRCCTSQLKPSKRSHAIFCSLACKNHFNNPLRKVKKQSKNGQYFIFGDQLIFLKERAILRPYKEKKTIKPSIDICPTNQLRLFTKRLQA